MSNRSSKLMNFHLAGQVSGEGLFDISGRGFRPALFSAYGDLSKLRYDYPVVLIRRINGGTSLRSLSEVFTEMLREIAPHGPEGERLRKHVLRLEGKIRSLTEEGRKGTLLELWEEAAANLLARAGDDDERKALDESLDAASKVFSVDGDVIGYDDEAPSRIVTHAWSILQQDKARTFSAVVDNLALKLSNILKADSMKSATAFGADSLRQTVGSSFESAFDFEAMSDILGTSFVDGALPEKRRERLRSVLSTLKNQTFFPPAAEEGGEKQRSKSRAWVFDSCAPALEAFRKRLPKMVDLVKAMTIARLEIEGTYKDSNHDPFFRRYDERYLEADDLALFPSYLVCIRDAREEKTGLIEILSSGLPIKVLVQNDDILEDLSLASGGLSLGVRGTQLASMALGLDRTFVLQASGADLYRLRESLLNGLMYPGTALFSVFSGASSNRQPASKRNKPDVPAYLRAASATEARAFPVFVRDPSAGMDWESRFSLHGNPQPEMDWPVHPFAYEDEALQRISEDVAFTFVDFAAMDERYAAHFAAVPRDGWENGMVPVHEFLGLHDPEAAEKVPYILMVDNGNALYRVIVEAGLIEAARRCNELWRRIRELGGIDNSYVRKALAEEKEIWERRKEEDLAALKKQTVAEAPAVPPAAGEVESLPAAAADEASAQTAAANEASAEAEAAETAPPSDEPWIETVRCTTCDECTQINDRMFAYNEDKQAYIADPTAGTYRQLVEAAESCQVAIIHPGKPLNLDEPGLEDLMARAEPFN
jgi:hypothetical protein